MTISTLSWNIAAVNNNPFEYFLTHPDPKYISLMEGVEGFIEAPGERDVAVGSVFTQAMYDDLAKRMESQGWDVAPVAAVWSSDLSQRTIIGGFLKDKGLGAKRLMSMPDRFTNTIDLAGGGVVNRPCITSNYDGDMSTLPKWWAAWSAFMFEAGLEVAVKGGGTASKRPCELISKIPRAKYPALSEEEEAMSVPLQALCLAVWDAVMLHIVCTLLPGGEWLGIKRSIVEALLKKKEARTLEILTGPYAATDILFLQEARGAFKPVLSAALGSAYAVFAPSAPSKSDQNSLVVLRTAVFDATSVVDVTSLAMAALSDEGKGKVACGDPNPNPNPNPTPTLTLTLTPTLTLTLTPTLTLTLTLTSALSMRRVPVLADVEREQRGEQRDLLGDMLELALRDIELPDRLGCHGTRYVRHARGCTYT